MKSLFTVSFLSLFLINSFLSKTSAQDDCCIGGLFDSIIKSGIFGGYGLQQYSAEGWNGYVDVYNQNRPDLTKKMDDFGTALGFKVGANLLQVQSNSVLFGVKFYFQHTSQKNEATANLPTGEQVRREYELNFNTWGIGTSVSYVINKYLDIKVLDASLTFTSTELKNSYIQPGVPVTEQILKSPESSTGFSIGSGIVFYPLAPYVAIEITGGYSIFSVDEMEFENGARLSVNENSGEVMTNFIDGGGFYAFAQLNVGIPF